MTLDKCLEMFKEFDTEIKALQNAYQDKEKASQSIIAKMGLNQHQAVKNAHLEVSDLVEAKV